MNSELNINYDIINTMNTALKKIFIDMNIESSLGAKCENSGCLIYKSIYKSLEQNSNKENVNTPLIIVLKIVFSQTQK